MSEEYGKQVFKAVIDVCRGCKYIHIIMYDESGKEFAYANVSPKDWFKTVKRIQDTLYELHAMKEE